MPIANCTITSECRKNADNSTNIVDLWASKSGKSSENMTINIVISKEQFGNKYPAMANLILPTIWSSPDVSALQMGLARALSQHYKLNINDVHVVTNLVDSGLVVEGGKEIEW